LGLSTNGAAKPVHRNGATPFMGAVLGTSPDVKLPDQGPWTISVEDLKQPMGFTTDLIKHKEPRFSYLWDFLSKETQVALMEKYAQLMTPSGGIYKPGPELTALVADLNKLTQGELIYEEKHFGNIDLSGDTLQLLEQEPIGTNLARLNRLLLEDAFQLDITPRPKILMDLVSKDVAFIDFKKKTVSLYDPRGKKLWAADLGASIDEEFRRFPYFRVPGTPAGIMNVGIWDVSFKADRLVVKLRGLAAVGLNLETGQISSEIHP
jgi:hypothetical protein